MICPHCHEDVVGTWIDAGSVETKMTFVCELCEHELESEDSYEDYISEMKAEYRNDD